MKPNIPIKNLRGENAESAIFFRDSTLNMRNTTENRKIMKKQGAPKIVQIYVKFNSLFNNISFSALQCILRGVAPISSPYPHLIEKKAFFNILWHLQNIKKRRKICVFCTKIVQCCSLGSVWNIIATFLNARVQKGALRTPFNPTPIKTEKSRWQRSYGRKQLREKNWK